MGIHEGSVFEGGGTGGVLYKKKDDAIAEAIKIFDKNSLKRKESIKKLDKEGEFYKTMLKHHEQFKWRKCEEQENRWYNTVDEIEVIKYTIQ